MSPEIDLQRPVAEVKVGVVAFGLRDWCDGVDQVDARHEALEPDGLGQLEVVARVDHRPIRQLPEHRVNSVARQGRRPRLAHQAMAFGERGGHRVTSYEWWVE